MANQTGQMKPIIAIIGAAAALLGIGYAVIMLPISGVKVVDSTTALIVVVVLFLLSGAWVFKNAQGTK